MLRRLKRRGHVRRETWTDAKEQTLLFGAPILACSEAEKFASDAEMRVAWFQHRERLLPEYLATWPGRRPYGWWRFEHGREKPARWWDEYRALEQLAALAPGEEKRFAAFRGLDGWECMDPEGTALAVFAAFFGRTRGEGDDGEFRDRRLKEWEFRRAWHAARGRTNLALFYEFCINGLQPMAA